MNDLRQNLLQTADSWAKLGAPALAERFVLRNGREFTGAKRPKGYRKSTPKACFSNAAKLVLYGDGLRYVEGFASAKDFAFPFLHAWAIDADDTVIDVTLKSPENYQYIGVVLSRSEMMQEISRNKVYGIIDPGLGLNARWMFELDPSLKAEVDAIKPFNMRKWVEANTEVQAS